MKFVSVCASLLPLVLPAFAILWLWRTRAKSRVYFWSLFAFTSVLIAASVSSYGYWFAVGMYWPMVLLALFALTSFIITRRGSPERWSPKVWSWELVLTPLVLALTLLSGAALPFVARAKSFDGEALELSPPLRGGVFVVLAGGANWSVNQHAYLGAPSMRYAIDISRLNRWGMRAAGLSPQSLENYAAFGAEVVAPCVGDVLTAEDDLPDRPPLAPSRDPGESLGNHVVIYCQNHSVVLAHLQQASVLVDIGDRVARGQPIGRVGNSGGTLEPHLHVHAVRGRQTPENDIINSAPGAPLRVSGRFLIKHEWFQS